MNDIEAIDCQSFAGGFTLGMAQAGFTVVAKAEEPGGFGVPLVEGNAGLINPDMEIQVGKAEEWEPKSVQVVFGNPPCSGFSGLSSAAGPGNSFAGTEAHAGINECMWRLVRYAARCEAEVVIMESVQAAYKKGRELMQALRVEMEQMAGRRYDLTHVLQNSASVGGASIRKRYFMVLSRKGLEFGIEPPRIDRVPVLEELIGDLYGQPLAKGPTAYMEEGYEVDEARAYGLEYRSASGFVDGHDLLYNSMTAGKAYLAEQGWQGGEKSGQVFARLTQEQIDDSPLVHKQVEGEDGELVNFIASRYRSTYAFAPVRLYAHKAAPVITGTGCNDFVHPVLPRTITFREAARIMGFPDDWSLAPMWEAGRIGETQKWLGKGITVQVGKWIGDWAYGTLMGSPGPWRGELIGEGEWLIDVTNDHKAVYNERTGEPVDSRSPSLRREMEARPTWAPPV